VARQSAQQRRARSYEIRETAGRVRRRIRCHECALFPWLSKWRSAPWRATETYLSDVRVTSGQQHEDYLAFAAGYNFVSDETS
jgi:hypothetical protein